MCKEVILKNINHKKTYKIIAGEVLFITIIVAVWYAIYIIGVKRLGVWKEYSMPSPQGVWNSFIKLISNGSLLFAARNSLFRGFLGYVISLFFGIVLGLLQNSLSCFQRYVRPLTMGIQTLPSICWVPFSILWFGLSEQAIVFVVIMGSVFGISISVDNAIKNIIPIYRKVALTMGANRRQIFFKKTIYICL